MFTCIDKIFFPKTVSWVLQPKGILLLSLILVFVTLFMFVVKCCVPFFFYSELTQIVTDVVADPTLPRTEDHECPKYVNFSFWVNLSHNLARVSLMFPLGRHLLFIDGKMFWTKLPYKKNLSFRSANQVCKTLAKIFCWTFQQLLLPSSAKDKNTNV